MEAALHRIEALPGAGRYTATFRQHDGTEVTAVVQLGEQPEVASAGLPRAWRSGPPLQELLAAVRAFDAARAAVPQGGAHLRDVDGGWDVSLGNVVLGPAGLPECIAHGALDLQGERYVCAECGAAAVLS